ncbi:ABC transporter ATP-binding protein [Desulfovibrio sp. OttesenSCG-928-I05]|nr:ABC transporter ATP-binding protein [Desulfovibrio sp. OttesenSCG-928-I05]
MKDDSATPTATPPLLAIEDLAVTFETDAGDIPAVDGVTFALAAGEVFCLVGESGSGKSATAHAVSRLIPSPPGKITDGRILLDGTDLLRVSENELRELRGNRIGMVFQEPMTSLNPVFRVGEQIAEPLVRHRGYSRKDALRKATELLHEVGIPAPQDRVRDFPHQMSGGMRQRVMIAMAIACEPSLVIADEPTTALDVTIQKQVLNLLHDLTKRKNIGLLLITHDLGIVLDMADQVGVMYCGKIVEQAPGPALFAAPSHPYIRRTQMAGVLVHGLTVFIHGFAAVCRA